MERTKTNNKHSFNGFFSMTTWVGWSQKAGKIAWDFTRDKTRCGFTVARVIPNGNNLHLIPDR